MSTPFPHMAGCVDDIALIRSMHTSHSNHYNATLGMHTGSFAQSRPSIGSWVTYGLGTLNRNLPGFVVIAPKQTYAGTQVFASDFLPGAYQGTLVVPGADPIANVAPRLPANRQQLELAALRQMNEEHLATRAGDPLLAARLQTFETAFGMQMAVPDAFDFKSESEATLAAGAGVKRGIVHGATDEIGLHSSVDPVHVRDFHANILHLMGFDHEKLTYRHAGLDLRLTGVEESHVVQDVLV